MILSPREAFYDALHAGAAGIILVHNCPCGAPEITPADRAMTDTLAAAGQLLGVPLVDHVVVARRGYASFAERGLLTPRVATRAGCVREGRYRITRPRLVRERSDVGRMPKVGERVYWAGDAMRAWRSGTIIAVYPDTGADGAETLIDIVWDEPAPGDLFLWRGTSHGLPATRLYETGWGWEADP